MANVVKTDKGKVRLDKYLWSIRLFKTRSLASEAIEKGRVKLKGDSVKASRNVVKGDVFEVRTAHKNWTIQVTEVLDHRLAFTEAVNFYKDLTPIEELESVRQVASAFQTGKRISKIGRPTKKDRRTLGDFLD